MTSWQKVIKYTAFGLAIFLAVSIIGGILGTVASLDFIFEENDITGEMQAYSLSDEISELDIDISAADFSVKTGDAFCVKSNNKHITLVEKNGTLVIEEDEHKWFLNKNDVKLELYIPEDTVFQKVDIVTGAGRVVIDSVSADNLSLKLGAGEAKIENLTALQSAEVNGGAGKITVNRSELANLKLDMGVGELEFTGKLTGECELNCGVGSTELTLQGTLSEYRIKVDKGLGETDVGGANANDGDIFGTGDTEINIDGGVGEVKVDFKDMGE